MSVEFKGTLFSCNLCSYQCLTQEDMTKHSVTTHMTPKIDDPINPPHYKGRDVMDIIDRYQLSFCLGNVVKYILRARRKGGYEDLLKAQWYLNEEIRIEGMKPKRRK